MNWQQATFSVPESDFERDGQRRINASRETMLDVLQRADLGSLLK